MAKKLSELFKPRAAGERAFFDKHKIRATPDPYGNGDDVRNGSSVKVYNRKRDHMGYNHGQDVAAYDKEAGKGTAGDKKTVVVRATSVGNWGVAKGYDDKSYAEEAEVELDELSKGALRTYKSKASKDMKASTADKDTFQKRKAGIATAQKKLNDFGYGSKKESRCDHCFGLMEDGECVDQTWPACRGELDELSKKTLGRYIKRSAADVEDQGGKTTHPHNSAGDKLKAYQKAGKRQTGIQKAVDRLTKEEVVGLDEYVTSRNRTNGFHGHIAGTNEEKKKLFHSFHRWVATATGVKMTEDPDVVRNFLDSAHGRFIAQRINANHPKEDVHHHTLARWKAFKTTYSPHHFKTVGEDVSEAWDMPMPHVNSAVGGAPTVTVKPDRRLAKWAAGDEIRRAAQYHTMQATEYSNRASEHRLHADQCKKAKKHALAGHNWALDGVMRKAARIHDYMAKHYTAKVGKHH